MKTSCGFKFSEKLSELAYASSKYFGDLISHSIEVYTTFICKNILLMKIIDILIF